MNIIAQAALELPGRWHQGSSSDNFGNYCGIGMVNQFAEQVSSDELRNAHEAMNQVAEEQYPERVKADRVAGDLKLVSFAQFNDHRDTTEEEVVAVMEKAAVRLDEING